MGIRHAKTLTLRGKAFDEIRAKARLVQVNHPQSPSLSKISSQDRECGIQFMESSLKIERPPITTTVFAATTPENTPFTYRASTSANPNPMISPSFVEANYEDYYEEREMEPRLEPNREATPPPLAEVSRGRNAEGSRPSEIKTRENGNRGMNLPPLLAAHLGRNESGQPLQSSLTSVYRGHQPTTNIGGNLPPNGIVNGQPPSFLFQAQNGNPSAEGTSAHHSQGGYIPQTFTNNSMFSYNRSMYPVVTPSSIYPFYTQPMYAPPNMPMYPNPNPAGPFIDSTGSVTPFVCWIEDYPLPDGLKMPSYISSYDGKGDPNNFFYLFEGAIRMQKWLMPVACRMFTYTLKDSARI
ncbi:hypothetical protein Tco_0579577 [Tanacetum coccineum]